MSMISMKPIVAEDIDVVAGALYAWCAEFDIKLESQAGLSAASRVIDLYHLGHDSQEDLLSALHAD